MRYDTDMESNIDKMIAEIEPDRMYGTSRAGQILRCSRQNVALQCMHDRLISTKLDNGQYLIKGSDLIAFLRVRVPRNTSKRQAMALSAGAS
jgi:hypothetical protein